MTQEQREELQKSLLSADDMEQVMAMMGIYAHAAERCMSILDNDTKFRYMLSKDYMLKECKYGSDIAKEMLDEASETTSMKRSTLGSILNSIKVLKDKMEKETIAFIKASKNDECKAFDDLQSDVSWLTKFYAIVGNCSDSDLAKLEGYAKLLTKGKDKVSDRVINCF